MSTRRDHSIPISLVTLAGALGFAMLGAGCASAADGTTTDPTGTAQNEKNGVEVSDSFAATSGTLRHHHGGLGNPTPAPTPPPSPQPAPGGGGTGGAAAAACPAMVVQYGFGLCDATQICSECTYDSGGQTHTCTCIRVDGEGGGGEFVCDQPSNSCTAAGL